MDFKIDKFAHLARVKLNPKESKKFEKDLGEVLAHFKEMEELDTEKVKPMTGGTTLTNIFRDDSLKLEDEKIKGGSDQFKEKKNGYLKVPKVFDK